MCWLKVNWSNSNWTGSHVCFANQLINVQFLRERVGHRAPGERNTNSAASQHHQTQGGAVSRAGGLAGEFAQGCKKSFGKPIYLSGLVYKQNVVLTWTFPLVAGGHEVGDQPTGAAEGGGQAEGESAREREHRAPEKQIFKSEGGRRERLLLFFQREMTDRLSAFNFANMRLCCWKMDNEIQASGMFTDLIFEYICIYMFVHMFLIFKTLYKKITATTESLICSVFYNLLCFLFCFVFLTIVS